VATVADLGRGLIASLSLTALCPCMERQGSPSEMCIREPSKMKFWIEAENLAIDTEEVSAYFYELCKQKAEHGGNLVWESPGREILVIAVIKTGLSISNLVKELKTAWSGGADFMDKVKRLDSAIQQHKEDTEKNAGKGKNKGKDVEDYYRPQTDMLIKVYPAPANVPYWLIEKKDCYKVSDYKKRWEDAFFTSYTDEEREVDRLRVLEGIPKDMPGSCTLVFQLIEEYKRLEEYATIPLPTPKEDEFSEDETDAEPGLNDPSVQNKIYAWLRNYEHTLSEAEKTASEWLIKRMENERIRSTNGVFSNLSLVSIRVL